MGAVMLRMSIYEGPRPQVRRARPDDGEAKAIVATSSVTKEKLTIIIVS